MRDRQTRAGHELSRRNLDDWDPTVDVLLAVVEFLSEVCAVDLRQLFTRVYITLREPTLNARTTHTHRSVSWCKRLASRDYIDAVRHKLRFLFWSVTLLSTLTYSFMLFDYRCKNYYDQRSSNARCRTGRLRWSTVELDERAVMKRYVVTTRWDWTASGFERLDVSPPSFWWRLAAALSNRPVSVCSRQRAVTSRRGLSSSSQCSIVDALWVVIRPIETMVRLNPRGIK